MDLSQGYDIARFYRNGATRFTLALLGRSEAIGLARSEGWAAVSGKFATPKTTFSVEALFRYRSRYDLLYLGSDEQTATVYVPMAVAGPVWQANTGATDAELKSLVDAALTAAGYTRPDGSVIA